MGTASTPDSRSDQLRSVPDSRSDQPRSVVWVDEVDPAQAVACAGSKMGRLTELHLAGVEVPRGFAVTVDAYRRHCTESGLDARIDEVIDRLGVDAPDAEVEKASAEIRALFEATPMPEVLGAEITEAYDELSLRCVDVNVPTAVRSSATGEDAADASFAGIFDTYLGVAGAQRVLDAVRRCWGSLFTGRALAYRLRKNISHHAMPIAVGVIELIHARASGVAFSVHPVTDRADRIVIEASWGWGWGEAIVQGLVNPDHVEVGKADGRVLKYDVAHKTIVSAFDFATGRVSEIDMPASLADRKVLDDEQIDSISAAVKNIEEHYGYPVDVEWVISRHRRAGDPVCIVQSRPVTVTAPVAAPAVYDPVALAQKYVFGGKPVPGR